MSRRIAHRPHYRTVKNFPPPSSRSYKDYLQTRWTYRRFIIPHYRRTLGQGLLLLPLGYKLVRSITLRA